MLGTLVGILVTIFYALFILVYLSLAVAGVVLIAFGDIAAAIIKIMVIITAVVSAIVFLVSLILLIVLTKKGKFGKAELERIKSTAHGKLKYVLMRIFQIILWVASFGSFIVTALCIVFTVLDPIGRLFY